MSNQCSINVYISCVPSLRGEAVSICLHTAAQAAAVNTARQEVENVVIEKVAAEIHSETIVKPQAPIAGKANDVPAAEEAKKEGAKEGRRSESSEGGGGVGGGGGRGGGRGVAGKTTNRHSECSASEAPVSLHPTPERKKKKKRRKRRSKSSSEADVGAVASGSQKEGGIVTNNAGSENALVKPEEGVEPRKGCKDCLMENCTGAVTLYRWIFNLLIYSSTLPLLLTGPTTRLSTSASSSRTTWWWTPRR